jgi:ADP-dependent NAD(P)H-hydrate dehydratase / NAD(P)H-hydrate epimerase
LKTDTEADLIGKFEVLPTYKPRKRFSHKGDFGHSLIIGGSYGKIGAVTLASRAALSVGSGLVTAYVPKCGYTVLQTALPEAMVLTDIDKNIITDIEFNIKPTVIGFGIGIGTDNLTITAFESFLKQNKLPLVIDADGINILSKKKSLLEFLPEQTILTPHPKELERLLGTWKDDFDKLKKVKIFSKKYNIIVVIKGANTITVFKDKLYISSTGNPGLATAGSGDVLTGIITGLFSQNYSPLEAAIFGVYLHGKSADIAVEDFGYESLIASHIIKYLGEAYLDIFKQIEEPPKEEKKDLSDEGKELDV